MPGRLHQAVITNTCCGELLPVLEKEMHSLGLRFFYAFS